MTHQATSRFRLVGLSISLVGVLAAAAGCSAAAPDPSAPSGEEHVATSEQELLGGGCSMAQIHILQSGCRSACGAGGSAGIDHCWPGTMTAGANVFADTSEGGICVCN